MMWQAPTVRTAYKAEYLLRDIERALKTHLEAALQAVELVWQEEEPVSLPMPLAIEVGGYEADVLNFRPEAFPQIALLDANRTPDTFGSDQRVTMAMHELPVEWIVTGATRREASLRNMRYAEAVLLVLSKIPSPEFHGFKLETLVPRVEVQPGMPFYGPDAEQSTPLCYIAGMTVFVPVKGSYAF